MIGQLTERAARLVERQQWLNKPGYKLEHGLAFAFGLAGARARPLQNLLQRVWLGHPLHPVPTDLPLGAWTAALVLDGVDVVAPRPQVAGLGKHPDDDAIVASVVGLARNTGKSVVAEGVETTEQLAHLRHQGVGRPKAASGLGRCRLARLSCGSRGLLEPVPSRRTPLCRATFFRWVTCRAWTRC